MTLLFLAAVLFAIPTSGLSLLAFIALLVGRGIIRAKVRMHYANEQGARRDLSTRNERSPSWINNKLREEQFFNGVGKLLERKSIPDVYVIQEFSSPQLSSTLFSLAANLESRGSSFAEQQVAAAAFVADEWFKLDEHDRDFFAT